MFKCEIFGGTIIIYKETSIAFLLGGKTYLGTCEDAKFLTNIVSDDSHCGSNSAMPISMETVDDGKIELSFRIKESRKRPRFICISFTENVSTPKPRSQSRTWTRTSQTGPQPIAQTMEEPQPQLDLEDEPQEPQEPLEPMESLELPESWPIHMKSYPRSYPQSYPEMPAPAFQEFNHTSLLIKNTQLQIIITQQQMVINQLMRNNFALQNMHTSINVPICKNVAERFKKVHTT